MITKAMLREELETGAKVTADFKQTLQEGAMRRAVRYAYPSWLERVNQILVGDAATTRFPLLGDVVGLDVLPMQPILTNVNRTRGLLTAPTAAPTVSTTAGAGWGIGKVYFAYAWSLDTSQSLVTQCSAYASLLLATNQRPVITIPTFPTNAQAAIIYASTDLAGNPDIRYAAAAVAAGNTTLAAIVGSPNDQTNPRPLREFSDIEGFDPELILRNQLISTIQTPNNDVLNQTDASAVLYLRSTNALTLGEATMVTYYRRIQLPTDENDAIPIEDDSFLTNAALGYYYMALAARELDQGQRDAYKDLSKVLLSDAAQPQKATIPPTEMRWARAPTWGQV